ncbi:MAG: hypothetical protein Tsb002_17930 [Wenzhouxiangellaceae bacterium]
MKLAAVQFELKIPRDSESAFGSELVKKQQTHLADDLERKAIALKVLDNNCQQVRRHI